MVKKFNTRFNKNYIVIYPGEYFVTSNNLIIATLLGTCISTCLIDEFNSVYGMNHFLLPFQSRHKKNDFLDKNALFGINAMEMLINSMMKNGADRKNLKAKIFGAGSILGNSQISNLVTTNNIEFVKEFLYAEHIPIVNQDLGGEHGRKIYFFTENSGKVLLKRITNEQVEFKINIEEKTYKEKIIKEQEIKNKTEQYKTSIIFGDDL
jgi:chemotaxis protein CheD